jgi:chemotaxis methyl-accepting protein methylase
MEGEIKELKEEIKELKEEIKELKEETHNKCFVDTDEEHSELNDNLKKVVPWDQLVALQSELIKIKKDLDYLMKMQKEREARLSKFFTYDSTDSE